MQRIIKKYSFLIHFSRISVGIHLLIYLASLLQEQKIIFIQLFNAGKPFLIQLPLLIGLLCCLCIIFNFYSKMALAALWICLVVILKANYTIYELHHGYFGLMIILLILSPFSKKLNSEDLAFFKKIQFFTLGLLSLNYSISGISKMLFSGWVNGNVSYWLLDSYVLRPEFKNLFGGLMSQHGYIFSLTVLSIEASSFFLFIFSKTRKYSWFSGLLLQIFILGAIQLGQISIFMIIVYIFAFNYEWVRKSKNQILLENRDH